MDTGGLAGRQAIAEASSIAPTERYTDGSYLERNDTWHVEDSPWKARQIEQLLARNGVHPKRVAEIGCGAGEILRQLSLNDPTATYDGYELSPQAYALAISRASERVRFHLDDMLSQQQTFDCTLCIDVFEHVPDVYGFLRRLRTKAPYTVFHIPIEVDTWSLLRGVTTGCRENLGHIHWYSRESALATLHECGYEVVDEAYTRLFDYLPATGAKARVFQAAQRMLHRVSPHRAVQLLGGCSLLVLAR